MRPRAKTSVQGPVARRWCARTAPALVGRREARHLAARLGEGAGHLLRVLHDLGDAEVEQLHRRVAPRLADDEDVGRLHVAVGDALAVGERQGLAGGVEEVHRLGRRPQRDPGRLLLAEDVLERRAFEPLEHHVGDVRPSSALEHPDVAGLHDGRGARREVGQERPFLDELVEEPLAILLAHVAERLEDLQGDGPLPYEVHRPVDGGEPAFADHALHRVLVGDRAADELQRVAIAAVGHGIPPRPSPREARAGDPWADMLSYASGRAEFRASRLRPPLTGWVRGGLAPGPPIRASAVPRRRPGGVEKTRTIGSSVGRAGD